MDDPPLDLLDGLTGDEAERLIRLELPETALYGLRFRQNAGRALLMPRPDPAKRAPLWLQRLRAKDLLQVVGRFPDYPLVVETFRECLENDLDLPRLRSLLDAIQDGSVRVVTRQAEIASPFASELIFQFTPTFLYEWDDPRRGELRPGGPAVDEDLLDALLQAPDAERLLDPQAVLRVDSRLRRLGHAPRSADEMAETLAHARRPLALRAVRPHGTVARRARASRAGRCCWSCPEPPRDGSGSRPRSAELYRAAFPPSGAGRRRSPGYDRPALPAHARPGRPGRADPALSDRSGSWRPSSWSAGLESGDVIRLAGSPEADARWAERENLAEVHRQSVAIRRRETVAVPPEVFADFLLRRQHLLEPLKLEGNDGLERVLDQLRGLAAPASFWENEILPRRVKGFRPAWLDQLLAEGSWLWRAARAGRDEPTVALVPREFAGGWPGELDAEELSPDAQTGPGAACRPGSELRHRSGARRQPGAVAAAAGPSRAAGAGTGHQRPVRSPAARRVRHARCAGRGVGGALAGPRARTRRRAIRAIPRADGRGSSRRRRIQKRSGLPGSTPCSIATAS